MIQHDLLPLWCGNHIIISKLIINNRKTTHESKTKWLARQRIFGSAKLY